MHPSSCGAAEAQGGRLVELRDQGFRMEGGCALHGPSINKIKAVRMPDSGEKTTKTPFLTMNMSDLANLSISSDSDNEDLPSADFTSLFNTSPFKDIGFPDIKKLSFSHSPDEPDTSSELADDVIVEVEEKKIDIFALSYSQFVSSFEPEPEELGPDMFTMDYNSFMEYAEPRPSWGGFSTKFSDFGTALTSTIKETLNSASNALDDVRNDIHFRVDAVTTGIVEIKDKNQAMKEDDRFYSLQQHISTLFESNGTLNKVTETVSGVVEYAAEVVDLAQVKMGHLDYSEISKPVGTAEFSEFVADVDPDVTFHIPLENRENFGNPPPNEDDYVMLPMEWAPKLVARNPKDFGYVHEKFRSCVYNILCTTEAEVMDHYNFVMLLTADYQPIHSRIALKDDVDVTYGESYDVRGDLSVGGSLRHQIDRLVVVNVTTTFMKLKNRYIAGAFALAELLHSIRTGNSFDYSSLVTVHTATIPLTYVNVLLNNILHPKTTNPDDSARVARNAITQAAKNNSSVNIPHNLAYADGLSLVEDTISFACHMREFNIWNRYPNDTVFRVSGVSL